MNKTFSLIRNIAVFMRKINTFCESYANNFLKRLDFCRRIWYNIIVQKGLTAHKKKERLHLKHAAVLFIPQTRRAAPERHLHISRRLSAHNPPAKYANK